MRRLGAFALLVVAAVGADDCMRHIGETLMPACTTDVESDACCAAMAWNATCSSEWNTARRHHVALVLAERRGPCDGAEICDWPDPDATCGAASCDSFYFGGPMTNACLARLKGYCAGFLQLGEAGAAKKIKCAAFDAERRLCGHDAKNWRSCALKTKGRRMIEAAVDNYTSVVRAKTAFLIPEAYEWIRAFGCADEATLSPKPCPCAVHDAVDGGVLVRACTFEHLTIDRNDLATSDPWAISGLVVFSLVVLCAATLV